MLASGGSPHNGPPSTHEPSEREPSDHEPSPRTSTPKLTDCSITLDDCMSPTASTSLGDISIDSTQLLDFAVNLEDYSYSFSFSELDTN